MCSLEALGRDAPRESIKTLTILQRTLRKALRRKYFNCVVCVFAQTVLLHVPLNVLYTLRFLNKTKN